MNISLSQHTYHYHQPQVFGFRPGSPHPASLGSAARRGRHRGHLLFRWRITQGGEDRMSTPRPCYPLTWTGRTAPQSRNYRPQSHTCGWWSTGLQAWRSLFGSAVSRSRANRAQPPDAIAARSCGAGTSSGGSTLGGWISTKRCGDQGRGPVQIERLRT